MKTGRAYHRLRTQWANNQSLLIKHLEIRSHTLGDVTIGFPQEHSNEEPQCAVCQL